MLRRIYTVISVWPQECFVFIVDAYRELQMSEAPTFHGAGRTHGVSPAGDNSGDSGRTRVVTARQYRYNNLCHHPPPRMDRASHERAFFSESRLNSHQDSYKNLRNHIVLASSYPRNYGGCYKLRKEKTQSDASRKHELEKETKLWSGPRLASLGCVRR